MLIVNTSGYGIEVTILSKSQLLFSVGFLCHFAIFVLLLISYLKVSEIKGYKSKLEPSCILSDALSKSDDHLLPRSEL